MVTNCPMQALQDMWSKDGANGFVEYNLIKLSVDNNESKSAT